MAQGISKENRWFAHVPTKTPSQPLNPNFSVLHDNLTVFKIQFSSPNYKFPKQSKHSHYIVTVSGRERKTCNVWVKSEALLCFFSSNPWICKLLLFQFPFSRLLLGFKVCIFIFSGVNCHMGCGIWRWGNFRALNWGTEFSQDFTSIWSFRLCLHQGFSLGAIKKKVGILKFLTRALCCALVRILFLKFHE